MDKDDSNSFNHNVPIIKEPDSNKSFVRKVRTRVSELIPSSLSKWFGNDGSKTTNVRQREEDEDDEECYEIQPPPKRARKPSPTATSHNHVHVNLQSTPIFKVNDVNHESDSGESTSGYSSMVRANNKDKTNPPKREEADTETPNLTTNKLDHSLTIGGHSRSLFIDRSPSPHMNSSLSSRRPSFNASTFGSPSFVDRTLSTQRIINSPFYNGRTTYGGASAYGGNTLRSPKDRRSNAAKNQVEIKKAASHGDSITLSRTARRILNTLEQFTSPVSDAKQIPNPLAKRTQTDGGLLKKYTGANPYLIRDKVMSSSASNRELQVPSVPDLLKMKLKERLQDSTVAVRQIATTSKSTLNADEYKIRTAEDESAPATKHTNKIKNKINNVRQKQDQHPTVTVEEVKLPEVSLPITTLPKFDFSLPLPPSCSKPLVTVACNDPEPVTTSKTKVTPQTLEPSKNPSDVHEYKFASPLVLAENLISIIAINDFKFSEPVIKQKGAKMADSNKISPVMFNFKSPDVPNNFKTSDLTKNITLKRKTKPAEPIQLFTGSVEEAFSNNNNKTDSWKCGSCSNENKWSSTHCLDCDLPRVGTKRKISTVPGFGTLLQRAGKGWECPDCHIQNLDDKTKCPVCGLPKSEINNKKPNLNPTKPVSSLLHNKVTSDWTCTSCFLPNDVTKKKCIACTKPKPEKTVVPGATGTFGGAFKKKEGEWECSTCMVRNSSDKTKCAACETPKPGSVSSTKPVVEVPSATGAGFGDAFKKKTNEWECGACMVRNSDDKTKCVACLTVKPGGTGPPTVTGSETTTTTSGFGQSFKRKSDEWECGVCMVRNSVEKTKCAACQSLKPGATEPPQAKQAQNSQTTFKFGIVPTSKSGEPPKFVDFNSTAPAASFTFGIPPPAPPKALITTSQPTKPTETTETAFKLQNSEPMASFKTPEKPSGFMFGVNTTTVPSSKPPPAYGGPKNEDKPKQQPQQPPMFTFGDNNNRSETVADGVKPQNVSSNPNFVFGAVPGIQKATTNNLVNLGEPKESQVPAAASSIIFSPPKQSLMPPPVNKIESKPPTGSGGNNNNNIFGNITSKSAPVAAPSGSFTFNAPPAAPAVSVSSPAPLFTFGGGGAKGTSTTVTTAEAPVFKFNTLQQPPPPPQQQQQQNVDGFNKPAPANMFSNTSASSIFGALPNKGAFESPVKSSFEATTTNATFGSGFGSSAPAPSSTFGGNAPPAGFGSPAPPPGTGGFNTSAASPFGISAAATTASGFGGSAIATPTTSSGFGGGGGGSAAVSSGFGSVPASFGAAPSGFGSTTGFGSSVVDKQPFTFGSGGVGGRPTTDEAAKAAAAAVPSMFSFGQEKQPEPAKPPAVFNFGGGSMGQNAPPAPGGFSFNPPAPNNATQAFNFGGGGPSKIENNPSLFQSAAPAANIFGTAPQPPQQQQQQQQHLLQNGGFNFGATPMNSNVKAGFNFGSAQPKFNAPTSAAAVAPPPQQQQPPSVVAPGVFGFGTPNPNQVVAPPLPPGAAGGFNFGPGNVPAPAFNANMKPTFNFTGGATPTFSAQPGPESPAVAQRRRLKATRRTQPR